MKFQLKVFFMCIMNYRKAECIQSARSCSHHLRQVYIQNPTFYDISKSIKKRSEAVPRIFVMDTLC
jgi:hypothetical protein